MTFKEKDYSEIAQYKNDINILIVTANVIETDQLHKVLVPTLNFDSVIKVPHHQQTYYVGNLGLYPIVHVRCNDMGTSTRGGSINTVRDAIETWKPKVVLMIGVAMGINEEKQLIGDVLVSEAIFPYEVERVGDPQSIKRGISCHAGSILVNRFKNAKNWEGKTENPDKQAKVIFGHILSGEKLIDNKEFRDDLLQQFPTAIGAEMEGAGVYSACQALNLQEWILIKGVCDYGDGQKGLNKEQRQNIACESAISLCINIFSSGHAFGELNIEIWDCSSTINSKELLGLYDKVLFDIYNADNEPFYTEREIDKTLEQRLELMGIWLSGPSGCGKSTLLRRFLSKKRKKYLLISLYSCINKESVVDLLQEMRFKIFEGLNQFNIIEIDNERQLINDIIDLVYKNFSDYDYIYIEEIPLDKDDPIVENFLDAIVGIQIGLSYKLPSNKPKLILSSINDPKRYLKNYQQKVNERIRFVGISDWDIEDIEKLVHKICITLKLTLTQEEKKLVIEKSKNKPRNIKAIIRSYLILKESGYSSINNALSITNIYD